MSRMFRTALILLLIWFVGYISYRSFNQEVWAKDSKTYVILPAGPGIALYYLWRPLMIADGALTGMNFHIGPHQE